MTKEEIIQKLTILQVFNRGKTSEYQTTDFDWDALASFLEEITDRIDELERLNIK